MKVSINWIKSIVGAEKTSANLIPNSIDELVEKIGAQLGAVDEVVDIGKKYQGIIIAKVVQCQKHPNADKLSVCLIDDGGKVKKVMRNKDDLVEVVCGAPNVAAGQLVAWLAPGATVPSTFDKEPLVLEAREIRGVVSNGMIASPKELGIGDEHEGILVIDKDAKPGDDFAALYRMDDYVIDIENKMFTHRPDCFGMLGIARELAGIQGVMFKSPSWYQTDAAVPASRARDDHKLTVKNEVPKLVPRFCALVIKDVKVGPSPVWLRASLNRVSVKSINNIVDLTNFYMYLTAQPLHAYDYDKVKTGILGVRLSKKGEELKLLGGKTVKLEEGITVITDGSKPIGLGGIMGGADTEVDENTKTIILECANFDMNTTRLAAMHHGLFTDATTRFTKNQSPRQNRAVIAKAADNILKLAGGRVSGKLIDDKHFNDKDVSVTTSRSFINERLGLRLSASAIKKLLENVEFKVTVKGDQLTISSPFWRTDIEIAEDIVEEVGRLYGYDHLPLVLPPRDLTPAKLDKLLSFKSRLRNILASAGANEVLTYSFLDGSLLKTSGQSSEDAYHIRNTLSPGLQHYRLSLMPSLLEKVHPNIKARFGKFALFEIGKTHIKGIDDSEKLPAELERVALVIARSADKTAGTTFYAAKKYADYLLNKLSILNTIYEPLNKNKLPRAWQIAAATYEPKRSAAVYSGKKLLGIVGEPSGLATNRLKLPNFAAGFEFDTSAMLELNRSVAPYSPLNRFPSLDQDICLRTAFGVSYVQLEEFLAKRLRSAEQEHGYGTNFQPIDIFQRPNDKAHKQTTWRITLWHPDRTLTTEETNHLLDKIASVASKELKAERI